jgi:hypothetical protein
METFPCAVGGCDAPASPYLEGAFRLGADHDGRTVWGIRVSCAAGHWYVLPDVQANPADAAS